MSDLSDAIERIDPEWLLQREGVQYKTSYGRSGRQLNMRTCPFCHTSEWKVYANAETMVGNCFSGSCPQRTWNKWNFMKGLFEVSGRDLANLVKELAREQGWRPKIVAPLGLKDVNTLDLPYSEPIWEMDEVPEYLMRRGVTKQLAQYFQLHWSEAGRWNYQDPDGRQMSQDYANRILLPIFDMDGEMVSFQGRDVTGESPIRYLFPPGFAATAAYLYNAQNASEAETVVLAEGVFDVIQIMRAILADERLKGTVPLGTFGMHLSSGNPSADDQMGRLRKMKRDGKLRHVVFLWDGEVKALHAAADTAVELARYGIQASVALTPDGKDPGVLRPHEIADLILNAVPCRSVIHALRLKKLVRDRYATK